MAEPAQLPLSSFYRPALQVFEAHLRLRSAGELERDLAENYAENVLLLTHEGPYHGHDGVRKAADVLRRFVSDGEYHYRNKYVAGEYAYLEWVAPGRDDAQCKGWDGFVIVRGWIVAQMVYFSCG